MIAFALATAALAVSGTPVIAHAAVPSRLLVEATEFRFTLSRTKVRPGPAIIQLAIRGEDPHDLRVVKRGTARAAAVVPETLPGGVAEWRGKLTRGKWTLYCSLEGHRAAGMRATLKVR